MPQLPFALGLFACAASSFSCGSGENAAAPSSTVEAATRPELTVYAATSTRDALQALEAEYEREHGLELVFNFGSSGDLAKQIVAAAKADVFLSAGDKEMDEVATAKLVLEDTRRPLLSNQLVVIEPADAPSVFRLPFAPDQLAGDHVELLSLANVESVPAGRYAKAWLEQRGAWDGVFGRVLPGVDVRAALAAVESGGAQAGIVYRTDAARSTKVRVVHAVPLEEGPKITYPIAVLAGRPHEREARAFAEFLAAEGGRAFEEAGFVLLSGAAAAPR